MRVLFVGNSLTFKNDLPALVHRLGGRRTPIFAGSFTADIESERSLFAVSL